MNTSKIFISNINSPLGYHLVECLRDDHLHLHHTTQIVGSLHGNGDIHPSVFRTLDVAKCLLQFCKDPLLLCRVVMECDVVVMDLIHISEESENILKMVEARGNKQLKTCVLGLTSWMNWAYTRASLPTFDTLDKDSIMEKITDFHERQILPFTSHDYHRRVPDALWSTHYQLEERLLNLANPSLNTYILCSGLIYGEDVPSPSLLHLLLQAWNGQSIPLHGNGNNYLPCIHIKDYLQYIYNIVHEQPKSKYFIATQTSRTTQNQLINTMKTVTGNRMPIASRPLKYITPSDKMMSSSVQFQPTPQCAPDNWTSSSIIHYFHHHMDQFLKYYNITLMKCILIGKTTAEHKEQMLHFIDEYYPVYNEEELYAGDPALTESVSSRKKIKEDNHQHLISLKQQKIEDFLTKHNYQHFFLYVENPDCLPSSWKNFQVELVAVDEHFKSSQLNHVVLYRSQEFYHLFKIPPPEPTEPEQQTPEEKHSEDEKLEQPSSEKEQEEELHSSVVSAAEEEQEIPQKSGPSSSSVEQYITDNVLPHIVEGYLLMEKQKLKPTLSNYIKVLKELYQLHLKKEEPEQ